MTTLSAKLALAATLAACASLLTGCANAVRQIQLPDQNHVSADSGAMNDPQAGWTFRMIDGFPRANTAQQVELALFRKERTTDSGPMYALVGREGFQTDTGVITESSTPATVLIHHSVPTLRATNGWYFINGLQSIVETDKTTTHSWGTKFVVWARPATPTRPRQDVIFSIENPVCVTPGVDLGITGGQPCTSGTIVPTRNYLIISYPDNAPPQITGPAPTNTISDPSIADFFRYAKFRAAQFGVLNINP